MTKKMQALVKTKKGPGAELKEVRVPEVRDDEVLVKVEAAAICGSDLHIHNWNQFASDRVNPPLIFGHEFFGEIAERGDQVSSVSIGDKIAAETHLPCGNCFQCRTGSPHICPGWVAPGIHFDGGFAEFVSIPQILAVKLPEDTVPEIGALYEPFGVALHAVLSKNLTAKTVAIFGCGPIGLLALAAARLSGASKVIAVEPSPYRLKLAKKMGATIAVNPNEHKVVQRIREETEDIGVDTVFEFSGSHIAVEQAFEAI
jgi:threonine 3-dehydrogenase